MRPNHLEVIVGTMYSGKSTELIRRVNRLKVTNLEVQVYKPTIDGRYSTDSVASHDGFCLPVTSVKNFAHLADLYEPNIPVLAIDEIQFLESPVIDLCENHVQTGGIAVVSALLKDFRDGYFAFADGKHTTAELLKRADHITFLRAICTYQENNIICGREATRVQRYTNGEIAASDGPLIQVGSKDAYEARCRVHFVPYTVR